FYETGQILIICMTAYQSRQLQQLKSFEIDASFKRVQGVIKEWEINAFIERYNKTLPFARVFTDVETANAYEHVFTEVFSIVENDVGHRLKFHHIDGEGVQKIVADAHEGQAKGLGLYLHKIDPSRTTTEHLEHIYQTCIVHYNWNIRNKKIPEEVKKMMYAIPNQETEAQVQLLLYQIESSEIPEAINWVRDKRDPWMLASISLVYSKMSREVWNLPPHNTNASESAHANINLDGKSLSLLSAILKGRDFDYHQWQTIETLEQYNIGDSINNSLVYRQTAAARRSQKRKVIRNTPTRRTRRMTTQHQSVGSEEPTLNSVNVSVNIDVEAEERRNELLRERVQMTRELLNMEKELSQIRNQQ
ncbi:6019_t:CDS:2, partial [Paraglomus brasilianum]